MTVLEGISRDEWLAQRKTGLGGSDAAAALGLSPWTSPFELWLDKTDQFDQKPPSEAMEWGLRLEPAVREAFTEKTGLQVITEPGILRHPDHPWMIASLDGWAARGERIVGVYEGKTASPWDDSWDPDIDRIPDHVTLQCQHYLAVADQPVCHGAVLIGGSKFRTFEVRRDDRMIADLITAEERWWTTFVEGDTPPPIDGHPATTAAIRDMFPESADTEIDLPPAAADVIERWLRGKEAKKVAEADEDQAANQLRILLGDNAIGRLAGRKAVTWKSHTQHRLNAAALRRDHPDLADSYTEETTVRPLKLARGFTL